MSRYTVAPAAREDLRMFTAGKYVILYRPVKQGIQVVQIVHSARDLAALFHRRLNS